MIPLTNRDICKRLFTQTMQGGIVVFIIPQQKEITLSVCLSFQAQVILNKWTNTDDSLCSMQPEDLHEREQTWSEILQSR